MKVIRKEMLVKADIGENNNKWWEVSCFEDFSCQVVNGRIGSNGQNQPLKRFNSEHEANRFIDSKVREKIKGGYKPFQGIAQTKSKAGMSRLALEMAASEQIRTHHKDVVSDLIKRLVNANVHSILKNTDLTYDEDTGLFQTPLGIVTLESIKDARDLLNKLSVHIEAKDFDSDEVKALLASYLMLIPQKVGRKLSVAGVLPDGEAIQKQNGILDDLEASIGQVEELRKKKAQGGDDAEVKIEVEKIFNCEINVVEDKAVIRKITDFFESTRQKMHASYGLGIKRVYEVNIDAMTKAFEEEGRPLGNIKFLWHGTRPGNVLSILKSGFVIPPTSSPFVCGRMFGNGVYYSDQSTKSLNYATGWWAGAREKEVFMFLADVAMGKEHIPRGPSQNLPAPGTDSTYAIGGKSGVSNNEFIVYKLNQGCIRYLVEFE
ncbi:WGR domain-containing protein [Pseudomonas sp. S1(2024)]|uniref:WGR domain-containing protein n=1 Tax=Pseudomonas sp. S1(2024) TaxID=3390191 RepID=UPI003978813F